MKIRLRLRDDIGWPDIDRVVLYVMFGTWLVDRLHAWFPK